MNTPTVPCGCRGYDTDDAGCQYPGVEAQLTQAMRQRDARPTIPEPCCLLKCRSGLRAMICHACYDDALAQDAHPPEPT